MSICSEEGRGSEAQAPVHELLHLPAGPGVGQDPMGTTLAAPRRGHRAV